MWIAILNKISSITSLPGQPGPEPGSLEIITELGVNMITETLGKELITE